MSIDASKNSVESCISSKGFLGNVAGVRLLVEDGAAIVSGLTKVVFTAGDVAAAILLDLRLFSDSCIVSCSFRFRFPG